MKKRIPFILVLSVLAVVASVLFWKFVPWAKLSAWYTAFSISDLSPVWYYSTVILLAVLLMIVLGWILDYFPKRRARKLYKPESPILIGEQKVTVEGFTVTPQSGLKPTELFSIENEARKTLSQIIGGFIVIVSLILTGANLAITQRETEKNRSLALEGQITDRFTKAIAQLGDSKLEVRLGGIYALERIAKDSERDHWTIMQVLTAYVRENASRNKLERSDSRAITNKNTKKYKDGSTKPAIEIQAALTIVCRRNTTLEEDSDDQLDLSNTQLIGADLSFSSSSKGSKGQEPSPDAAPSHDGFDLSSFTMSFTLKSANLGRVKFLNSDLSFTDLRFAYLVGAKLNNTILRGADLSGADLDGADLSGADLRVTNLTWKQVSTTIIDDETKLPPEIENQHKDVLKAMREKTRKERAGLK